MTMVLTILIGLLGAYALGIAYGVVLRALDSSPYPSPQQAQREMDLLAAAHPDLMHAEVIGSSTLGQAITAYRLRGGAVDSRAPRPQLLLTAQIHAVEFIGSYVVRAVARRMLAAYGNDSEVTALLDGADIWIVPLVNPDGASRVWQRRGWGGVGGSRFTATGVDPNRNFPFLKSAVAGGWNSASDKPGSAYYRGSHPLSEPECAALARLATRERFCAALNFHSFGGVVFMPLVDGEPESTAAAAFAVFGGPFQARQRYLRYRPVPERSAKTVGQLDSFLLQAFGTASVTIEVSRPGLHLLLPWNLFNVFWWANPANPRHWSDNDVDATVAALCAVLIATGGKPCVAAAPDLASAVS